MEYARRENSSRHFFQHVHGAGELRVEVTAKNIEHLDQSRIADGIEDLVARLPADNNHLRPQNRQVLGCVGLLYSQLFDQFPSRHLAITQSFDDRDPGGIGQRLEDLAFELPEGIAHINHYIRIIEYTQGQNLDHLIYRKGYNDAY